jgi:hypothetical protein
MLYQLSYTRVATILAGSVRAQVSRSQRGRSPAFA